MKSGIFLRPIQLAGVVFVIIALLALNVDKTKKQLETFDISSIETAIVDSGQLDSAVVRLEELYHCNFPYAEVDSLVGSLIKDKGITAYQVTKFLIKELERSSLEHATDLQVELLYWLSRSDRSFNHWRSRLSRSELIRVGRARNTTPYHYSDEMVKKGRYDDLADIEQFGKLAMNWIHHEDPFIRGFAEWAIANRIDLLNSEPLKTWPENEKRAPEWYHVWRGLLGTGFVLEADYIRQGVRLNMHRSSDDIVADAGKIIERSRSLQSGINSAGNEKARSETKKWMDRLSVHYDELKAAAEEAPGKLTPQRKIWLNMRKLAREIILNNPDIKHEQILLALRHAYHFGGNITNGGKSYNHKPGGDVHSLSNNKDFDRYPHVMNNGKIIYTRWEYQERHLWQVHNLWACRPDGSYREPLFKQHNHEGNFGNGPMSLRDARAIPNSDKLVAVGTGHHEWAEGGLYLIDYQKGINEPDGFRIITPEIADVEGGLGDKKIVEAGSSGTGRYGKFSAGFIR